MRNRTGGFTFVEFAMVIAMIAVLGLLALSDLDHVRGVSRRASCQNNLKQWGLVYKMYSGEDRRGYWPTMSDYAYGQHFPTYPDFRSIYPDYMSDPTMGVCPKDTGAVVMGGGNPERLPFESGIESIRNLIQEGTATQDCMLMHLSWARSYTYFGYVVHTPAEGEVAWTAWSRAGDAALAGVHGAARALGHEPDAFGLEVDLGPECPYGSGAPVYHLHGRSLAGTLAPELPGVESGPFTTPQGHVLTSWRGDPAADWPTELGWDPETGRRVPGTIYRLGDLQTPGMGAAEPEYRLKVAQSEIPVMWDAFFHTADRTTAPRRFPLGCSPGASQLGANVLFMDGHVEFIRWVPPVGDKFPIKATAPDVFGDGKEWLNKTATGMP